jgi:hypothetical protein
MTMNKELGSKGHALTSSHIIIAKPPPPAVIGLTREMSPIRRLQDANEVATVVWDLRGVVPW